MTIRDGDFHGAASGSVAVNNLGEIAREKEKTRRILIGASCVFFVVGALVLIFAPKEREVLANCLGIALIILALGAIGVAKFKVSGPGIDIDTREKTPEKKLQPPQSQSL